MTVSASATEHVTKLMQSTAEGDSISEPTKTPLPPSDSELGKVDSGCVVKRLQFAHRTSADGTHLAVELWADIGEGHLVKIAQRVTERIVVCEPFRTHGQNKASLSSVSSIELGTLTISGVVHAEDSMFLTQEVCQSRRMI